MAPIQLVHIGTFACAMVVFWALQPLMSPSARAHKWVPDAACGVFAREQISALKTPPWHNRVCYPHNSQDGTVRIAHRCSVTGSCAVEMQFTGACFAAHPTLCNASGLACPNGYVAAMIRQDMESSISPGYRFGRAQCVERVTCCQSSALSK